MTHNSFFQTLAEPPTSARHTAEGGWLCGRVAATRHSRGAAETEGGGTSDA